MGLNPTRVYLPSPDQSTATGAVLVAAVDASVTRPIDASGHGDARTALSGWNDGGYVDENGVSLSTSRSTTAIKDWAQSVVRSALTDFTGTISLNFLQVDEFSATRILGAANVDVQEATDEHGNVLTMALGASMPAIESWVFNMKDEERRVRIYVPRGQVTEIGETTFVPGAANVWPATITTYDDGTGHSIYVIYDDGTVLTDTDDDGDDDGDGE